MLLTDAYDLKRGQGKIICVFPDKPDDIARLLQNAKNHEILNSLQIVPDELPDEYPGEDADRDFSEIAYRLTMEVKKNIEILQRYGYDTLLREVLDMHQPQLSRMEITADLSYFSAGLWKYGDQDDAVGQGCLFSLSGLSARNYVPGFKQTGIYAKTQFYL